jgi:hypothetical protein
MAARYRWRHATLAVVTATLLGAGCGQQAITPKTAPITDSGVSFSRDIAPLLRKRCAVCHLQGDEPGSMALTPARAYSELVGIAAAKAPLLRVEPGSPANSYFYHKLVGSHLSVGGEGSQMPFMAPPLSQQQIDKVAEWISHGAQNN